MYILKLKKYIYNLCNSLFYSLVNSKIIKTILRECILLYMLRIGLSEINVGLTSS